MDEVEDLTLKPPKVPVKLRVKPSRIMLRVVDTGVHQHYEENSSKLPKMCNLLPILPFIKINLMLDFLY